MLSHPIFRVCAIHLAFHTVWVMLFLVSLAGVFILIPLVGWYNAFVLGFIGKPALYSPFKAAFLGYLVFAATGLCFGWIISFFRLKAVWMPALASLFITVVLLIAASWTRHATVGIPIPDPALPFPATTGRLDLDELSMALKTEYDLVEPAVPPYLSGMPSVIPLAELQSTLRLLPKDFSLRDGPYDYCNLRPQIWQALRRESLPGKYPLVWSRNPDATGNRFVIVVNLKTDVFSDELVSEEAFNKMLTQFESAVAKQTGNPDLDL